MTTRKEKHPRKTIATYGTHGQSVGVLLDRHSGRTRVRVEWYEGTPGDKRRRVKSWPDSPDGRPNANAWAAAFAAARAGGEHVSGQPSNVERLTTRRLWESFLTALSHTFRPNTKRNYSDAWNKWELFRERDSIAEDVRAQDVDLFCKALRNQGLGVNTISRIITAIKRVYRWAERQELLVRNRLATYRYEVGKDEMPESPGEYTAEERADLIGVLSMRRDRRDGWRPWIAALVADETGAREHEILHFQWADVDWERRELVVRSRWSKTGRERRIPMTHGLLSALLTARRWRELDGYGGPWIFYSGHTRKRELGEDPRAVYDKSSLWLALTKAESAAGIPHEKGRAMHGFRRGVGGDIWEATGDFKLAMDFIGDVDLRQARRYLKPRTDRLERAAAVLDALAEPKPSPNRHQMKEPKASDWELVGVGSLEEQARQDLNLQPPVLETGALPIELRT